MPVSEETKKKLLYGAGALASIVGLLYIFKKSSGSSMPISSAYPSGSSGGGSASNSALTAAQIQAATQLTVAQSQKEIALAQIAASKENLATQTQAQLALAKTQEQGKIAAQALSPGGVAQTATKDLFDTIKKLFGIGESKPGSNVELDSQGNPMVLGASGLLSGSSSTVQGGEFAGSTGWSSLGFGGGGGAQFEPLGWNILNQIPNSGEQPYIQPMSLIDYYSGSIGSGDSGWFGSSPSDFAPGQFSDTGWASLGGDQYPTSGGATILD